MCLRVRTATAPGGPVPGKTTGKLQQMSTIAAQDLRELEMTRVVESPALLQERGRLRRLRVHRIADDVRERVYLVDPERVAASILAQLR